MVFLISGAIYGNLQAASQESDSKTMTLSTLSILTVEQFQNFTLEPTVQLEGPVTYQWLLNDRELPETKERQLHFSGILQNLTGVYSVRMTLNSGMNLIEKVADVKLKVKTQSQITASSDFDQNGLSDLLFEHEEGFVATWTLDAEQVVKAEFIEPGLIGEDWSIAATGNLNGDETTDILLRHISGAFGVWYMQNPSLATESSFSPNVEEARLINFRGAAQTQWSLMGAADFDGDEKGELVMLHPDGTFALGFLNQDRQGRTHLHTIELFPQHRFQGTSGHLAAIADFDRDHHPELLMVFEQGEMMTMGLNRKNGTFLVRSLKPRSFDRSKWEIVATGDYDRNLSIDLIFRSKENGNLAIWLMDGLELMEARIIQPANPGVGWNIVGPR
ncbi:MAG TPA: hypothetical protein EYQ50_13845 [Verrucomicrobiales bacterium]|nr:hypothetical protein [Verrucomicrobiales bacterium]